MCFIFLWAKAGKHRLIIHVLIGKFFSYHIKICLLSYIICFDYVLSPLPNSSQILPTLYLHNFLFFLWKWKTNRRLQTKNQNKPVKQKIPKQIKMKQKAHQENLWSSFGVGPLFLDMVDRPGGTPLEETDFPLAGGYQLQNSISIRGRVPVLLLSLDAGTSSGLNLFRS